MITLIALLVICYGGPIAFIIRCCKNPTIAAIRKRGPTYKLHRMVAGPSTIKRNKPMLEMRVSDIAEQIVMHVFTEGTGRRQEGSDGGRDVQAIYMNFDVRLSNYDLEENRFQYCAARGLHLLYHKLRGGAQISVFSAVSSSPFDRLKTIKEWKHEATHDSCWKNVRVFAQTYLQMAEEVNTRREMAGLPAIAPDQMMQYCHFAGFNEQLFQWVPVEITKDPNDQYNYRRLITVKG